MPPAYPAPSPDRVQAPPPRATPGVSSSRSMRTGELPRASGPTSTASGRNRPCQRRSICGRPCRTASAHHRRQHLRAGRTPPRRAGSCSPAPPPASGPRRKSAARCTGERYSPRPSSNARLSYFSWSRMPGQHVGPLERLDRHRHHQPAVGERRVPLRQAHAVGAEVPLLRHARDDVPAGAHAEREQVVLAAWPPASSRRCRAVPRTARAAGRTGRAFTSVLRVFDADAELERLRRHRHARGRPASRRCRGRCGRSASTTTDAGMNPDDVATPFSPPSSN